MGSGARSKPSQFLRDTAAFVVRQANVAANPRWEGVELSFTATPAGDGLRLAASRRGHSEPAIDERLFAPEELLDSRHLADQVDAWVRALPVDP